MYVCVCHIYVCIYTYMHAYIHAYTHTYISSVSNQACDLENITDEDCVED